LNELAELQTRVDRKYFVPADVFRQLIAKLADQLRVLDIDALRSFDYESVYFDTPELSTYRAHLQRRRLRFKARTRTYLDSGLTMFEVKLTGARGETVKRRVPHPIEHRTELTDEALAHLAGTLCAAYHQDVPPGMRPTLVTAYSRTTFASRTGEMRLTCDTGLVCRDQHHEVRDSGTHVLVEQVGNRGRQHRRPDAAQSGRATDLGEQVRRRRRRPAPRAALQPLAPDAAALLHAASGRLT
jgi:VTC domain